MDFPLICPSCGSEVWVDLDNPDYLQLDNLAYAEIFWCACGGFITFSIHTQSMDDLMSKLNRCNPKDHKFKYLFLKTLRKAVGVREKYTTLY